MERKGREKKLFHAKPCAKHLLRKHPIRRTRKCANRELSSSSSADSTSRTSLRSSERRKST